MSAPPPLTLLVKTLARLDVDDDVFLSRVEVELRNGRGNNHHSQRRCDRERENSKLRRTHRVM